MTIYGLPWGFANSRAISKKIISISQIDSNIQEQIFKEIADGIVIFVGKKSKESKILRGIIISESRDNLRMHQQDILTYTQGLRYFMGVPEKKALESFLNHIKNVPE